MCNVGKSTDFKSNRIKEHSVEEKEGEIEVVYTHYIYIYIYICIIYHIRMYSREREGKKRGCPATSNAKIAEVVHEKGLEKWRL